MPYKVEVRGETRQPQVFVHSDEEEAIRHYGELIAGYMEEGYTVILVRMPLCILLSRLDDNGRDCQRLTVGMWRTGE